MKLDRTNTVADMRICDSDQLLPTLGSNRSVDTTTPNPFVAMINEFSPYIIYPLEFSQKPALLAHLCLQACSIS